MSLIFCLECSQRLVDAYVLQCDIKGNDKFLITTYDTTNENVPSSFSYE